MVVGGRTGESEARPVSDRQELADDLAMRNEVRLLGRLSAQPERRSLPSGDEVLSLRVVVRRPGGGADALPVQLGPAPPAGRRVGVGQVGRRVLAAAERLTPGTVVEVTGSLRRRWWAGPEGRRSLIEVQARQVSQAP